MKLLFVAFVLCLVGVNVIKAQNCTEYTTCSDCAAAGPCGWCGPTGTCSPGTAQGPTVGRCYGSSWFFHSCPNCSSQPDCKSCLFWESDCQWCSSNGGQCREWGSVLGCGQLDTCPCDVYGSCSECVSDVGCVWCNGTCAGVNDGCAFPSHTCPCSDNQDCDSCLNDQVGGCVWCDNLDQTVGHCAQDGTAGCFASHNCNTYCNKVGTTCGDCNNLPGCGWCPSTLQCVDASVSSCLLQHSCPDCGSHRYCDPCQDEGCVWCENGECRNPTDTAGCFIKHTCDSYCQGYPDCTSCNMITGCGWCEASSACVDSDKSSCLLAHSCSDNGKCGFDGGAFVGGMFLGIGLVAIGVGGYLFYRWKMGNKPAYSELH